MDDAPKKVRKPKPRGPWDVPEFDIADAVAIKALQNGTAEPHQQQRALKWIIEAAAGTYDQTFYPGGEDGRRSTDFAEGRRSVGLRIVHLANASLEKLRRIEKYVQANPVPTE